MGLINTSMLRSIYLHIRAKKGSVIENLRRERAGIDLKTCTLCLVNELCLVRFRKQTWTCVSPHMLALFMIIMDIYFEEDNSTKHNEKVEYLFKYWRNYHHLFWMNYCLHTLQIYLFNCDLKWILYKKKVNSWSSYMSTNPKGNRE